MGQQQITGVTLAAASPSCSDTAIPLLHPPPPGMKVRSRARNVTAVDVSVGRIGANLNVSAVYRNVKFQRFIPASELMTVSCVPRDCLLSH